jgi:hypothetical protein
MVDIGDKGQRYEVICKNKDNKSMKVGWTDVYERALDLKRGIELHPILHSPEIIDRKTLTKIKIK